MKKEMIKSFKITRLIITAVRLIASSSQDQGLELELELELWELHQSTWLQHLSLDSPSFRVPVKV